MTTYIINVCLCQFMRLTMDRKVPGSNLGQVGGLGPRLNHALKGYLAMLREVSSILSWGWVQTVCLVLQKPEISTSSMGLHGSKKACIHQDNPTKKALDYYNDSLQKTNCPPTDHLVISHHE